MTLEELIAELEAATGPNSGLDTEIAIAVRWSSKELGRTVFQPPKYTSSIDAALTLVPEGWNWHVWGFDNGLPSAELTKGDCKVYGLLNVANVPHHPAIALCIAALKARASPNPSL